MESGIYLFTGPEAGEKNEAIANIKEMARKANGTLDEYSYYTQDIRVLDVISQLQNEGLFTQATFITLRNAEQIKASDATLIAEWAKSCSSSPNTLVLVSDENSVDKKIESAVPSNHKKIFWEMFENRKPQWVKDYFRKNGFSVTDSAVEQILEMVEHNTEALKTECSKFFYCFDKGYQVTEKDVEKILSHNREETAFSLFDAMADSTKKQTERFATSLEILNKIRLSKESNSVALITGLLYCFRQLRVWHTIHESGAKPGDADLKAAGFRSKTQISLYSGAAKVWTPNAVSSIIALLSQTDMDIRSTGTALEETTLVLMLYSIVMKNGAWCSEYIAE